VAEAGATGSGALWLRKDKRQRSLQLPQILVRDGPYRVVVDEHAELQRLIADPNDFTHASADRDGPLVAQMIQLAVISEEDDSVQPSPK
jgi:hypothetical protein